MLSKSKFCSYIAAVLFIVLIIVFPDTSTGGVSRGLLISSNIIIPSLFPFIACVLMIVKSGFCIKNKFLNSVIYKLFGQNFDMFSAFFLSMLGGYPIGAKLINELYKQKTIDNESADIMLMYCVNAGPAFIISVVGVGGFCSKTIGIVLLVSHITSSVIVALFCNKKLKRINHQNIITPKISKSFSEIFVESVADACKSILSICSFVIIFSVVNAYLDLFLGNASIIKYLSYFTEVTFSVTKTKNLFFVSFLLGFSGLSIWCQIFALSRGRKINFTKFFIGRIIHGTISVILTKIIVTLFKIKISTFSNNISIKNDWYCTNKALFFSMIIMLMVLFTFIYYKNNSGKILKDVV